MNIFLDHHTSLVFVMILQVQFGYQKPPQISTRNCPYGELLCGNQCYDKSVYSCQKSGNKAFVCLPTENLCGDTCYDPFEKTCYGSGDFALVCPWDYRRCGRNCYDPKIDSCNNAMVYSKDGTFPSYSNRDRDREHPVFKTQSCQGGKRLCGRACYDPKRQSCFESKGRWALLCPKGQQRCGSNCYNSRMDTCSEPEDEEMSSPCPSGQMLCEGRCYNPLEEGCFVSQGSDDQNRETNNYNSNNNDRNNEYYHNHNMDGPQEYSGQTIPQNKNKYRGIYSGGGDGEMLPQEYSGQSLPQNKIKNRGIYSSSNNDGYQSNKGYSSNGGYCPSGQNRCGQRCYDPLRLVCLRQGNEQVLCESGQEACGKKCYDPFNQRCFTSNFMGRRVPLVCRWNESPCGNTCSADRYNCNQQDSF